MAQKYYNTEETAKILGVGEDDVKKMLERRELHGYRDGANWKFKSEDIDSLAKQRASENPVLSDDEAGDDVLLSEVALGQSSLGTSGTVIGMNGIGLGSGESDIQLAGSSIVIGDTSQTPPAKKMDASGLKTSQFEKNNEASGSKTSQFENLDLSLDDDISLQSSTGTLSAKASPSGSDPGGSAIDLSGRDLEDDDLVLGGSGKGSDVTIGGDSGISLVDPADSGLSLEQPLDLAGGSDESLELGEDDMLALGEGGSSPAMLKSDSDFLLTPLQEAADVEESESGSQVIALDSEADDAAAMVGAPSGDSMASMLDEGIGGQSGLDMGLGTPMLGPQPGGLAEGAPAIQPASFFYEPPYTGLQIAGLATCAVFLMLCGMMMYDNLRNMWSWDGAYTINSSLMDLFVGLFEGK